MNQVLHGGHSQYAFFLYIATNDLRAADAAPVPEPNVALLLVGGLAALTLGARRIKA